jgi:hypothetical protein
MQVIGARCEALAMKEATTLWGRAISSARDGSSMRVVLSERSKPSAAPMAAAAILVRGIKRDDGL